jgi:hypothetical protein
MTKHTRLGRQAVRLALHVLSFGARLSSTKCCEKTRPSNGHKLTLSDSRCPSLDLRLRQGAFTPGAELAVPTSSPRSRPRTRTGSTTCASPVWAILGSVWAGEDLFGGGDRDFNDVILTSR